MIISEHYSEDQILKAVVHSNHKVELYERNKLVAILPGTRSNAEDIAEDWCLKELSLNT